MPESPGSPSVGLGDTYAHHDTIWDLYDLSNPIMVHNFNQAAGPILFHATVIRFGADGPSAV
ncbi:MAG: hypothetical protein ACI9MS_002205 [Glaciecola sp.]|jgi:hypothetical protein